VCEREMVISSLARHYPPDVAVSTREAERDLAEAQQAPTAAVRSARSQEVFISPPPSRRSPSPPPWPGSVEERIRREAAKLN